MTEPPPGKPQGRLGRKLVFGIAVAWVAFLVAMVVTTANPVTLNRDQILMARTSGAVVVAEVVDARGGQVRVANVLSTVEAFTDETAPGHELKLPGLSELKLKTGERVVLPLIRWAGKGGLVIAPTPTGQPQVYPADKDVVRDVELLLAAR